MNKKVLKAKLNKNKINNKINNNNKNNIYLMIKFKIQKNQNMKNYKNYFKILILSILKKKNLILNLKLKIIKKILQIFLDQR